MTSSNTAAFTALGFGATATANPAPLRVNGPPFATASGLVAGTAANTVSWYTGETGTDSARGTAVARVDQSITVQYGARANEQALRYQLQNIAVYAAVTTNASNPNASAQINALQQRISANLAPQTGQQSIQDMQAEFAGAQTAIKAATDRQTQLKGMAQTMLDSIEGHQPGRGRDQDPGAADQPAGLVSDHAMLYQTTLTKYPADRLIGRLELLDKCEKASARRPFCLRSTVAIALRRFAIGLRRRLPDACRPSRFEQLLFMADQLLGFLQRVIEIAVQDVIVDALDERPCARHRGQDIPHQAEIGRVMRHRVRRQVHQLHSEIDQLGRRIGGLGRQDVFFAQDRDPVAVDQESRALIGVGDDAGADDDPFVRLEFDFQGHAVLLCRFLCAAIAAKLMHVGIRLCIRRVTWSMPIELRSFPIMVNDW